MKGKEVFFMLTVNYHSSMCTIKRMWPTINNELTSKGETISKKSDY
jgi:hypothetical protein